MLKTLTACVFVALASSASAQDTTIYFEDFENGTSAGWTSYSYTSLGWRHVLNGECGAVTSMMACNYAATCDYDGPANPDAVILESPVMYLPATNISAALFSFDYIYDVDAVGEHMTVYVLNMMAPFYPFMADLHLIADGALHTVTMDIQFPMGGPFHPNAFGFQFLNDDMDNSGRGLLIDNVRVSIPPVTAMYCTPTAAEPCPCPASGVMPTRGCPSSLGFGALLRGAGNPSVSADGFRLTATSIPNGAPVLFFEGTAQLSIPFGDGRLCTGGMVTRLGIKFAANGTPVLPDIGETPISALTAPSAGETRYYQIFYRDPAGPCGSGFNLTNGWSVAWVP